MWLTWYVFKAICRDFWVLLKNSIGRYDIQNQYKISFSTLVANQTNESRAEILVRLKSPGPDDHTASLI